MKPLAAIAARVERSEFKKRLKNGQMRLRDALDHPTAQKMTVGQVVGAMPFSRLPKNAVYAHHAGRGAQKVCRRARVPEATIVSALTRIERDRVAAAYRVYHS